MRHLKMDDAHWGGHDGRRGRHGGFGPGGPGPGGMGAGGMGPFGRGRDRDGGPGPRGPRGGRRMGRQRGDVRAALLVLLAEEPRHGYDLMRAIEERTGGAWSPSPGSVYPSLQALEDEGLVTLDTVQGKRTASITDAGRAWLEAHAGEAEAVFAADAREGGHGALRREVAALAEAAMHVARQDASGTLTPKATQVLSGARKELYRLLAESGD